MFSNGLVGFFLQGWEKLTDAVIKHISNHQKHVVFMLWGAYAQKKGSVVDKVCAVLEYIAISYRRASEYGDRVVCHACASV